MPDKRKIHSAKTPRKTLRGAALVQEVIEHVRESGLLQRVPEPLAPSVLASLHFSSGECVPPSLATWLAFDSGPLDRGSLPFAINAKKRTIATLGFADMFQEAFSFGRVEMAAMQHRIPGRCVLLPLTSDAKRFLYLGRPDEHGEYPVFVVIAEGAPQVFLEYPGLDVLLAFRFGLVPNTMTGFCDVGAHPTYNADWKKQAKLNLPTGGLDYDEL